MTRMLPINGIYYAFFPRSKRLVSIIQMPDAFRAIHHRGHLFQLIIAIRTALGQQPHPAYRLTVRVGTYIFKISQPSLVDKASILHAWSNTSNKSVKGSPLNRQGVAVSPKKRASGHFSHNMR